MQAKIQGDMNTLGALPTNRYSTRPNLSSWIQDWFGRDLNTLLDTNFNSGMSLPAVNIRETNEAYLVEMAVPGMKRSDFTIDVDHDVLTISSSVEEHGNTDEGAYTRREFGYSSFKRSFTLPESVDDSGIRANYKDGLLKIHLPKKEEARPKPMRSIKVL